MAGEVVHAYVDGIVYVYAIFVFGTKIVRHAVLSAMRTKLFPSIPVAIYVNVPFALSVYKDGPITTYVIPFMVRAPRAGSASGLPLRFDGSSNERA
jgi:hypothetical protein